ncbi:MAG: glycosyltransferase [Dysgonamonadaceae bacterium]|jgi:glycosyltransferase involved in cell wall biosynthesis|nr:glycosyltransferase [Dysgonamonadaceae bacterium]
MNILLINDYWEHGGAEAVFREQFDMLQKDFRVEVFYAFNNVAEKKISPVSYIYSFRFRKKLAAILNGRAFDMIIVHNYSSALSPAVLDTLLQYGKSRECKIIYYAHDFHLVCPNRGYNYFIKNKPVNFETPPSLKDIIFKRLDAKSISFSILKKLQWILAYPLGKKQKTFDLILSPSDFLAAQIKLLYPEAEIRQLYNVCNALHATLYPSPFTPHPSPPTLRLVYFGRLDPVKGLSGFIEAIKDSAVNYTFTVIGEGEERETLQNAVKKFRLEDKIIFKPKMNPAGLFAELQNYDVFVLPSLWYENAPLSVVEAASLGLGLFLSRHGGVLETGKICNAGHFFNPFDRQDIVSQMEVLYGDFIAGVLPKADREKLNALFSREAYTENLKKYLCRT